MKPVELLPGEDELTPVDRLRQAVDNCEPPEYWVVSKHRPQSAYQLVRMSHPNATDEECRGILDSRDSSGGSDDYWTIGTGK